MMDQLESAALHSPYPPSFDGNPWSYGFALFSLTLMCALSLAILMRFLFETRANAAAWRMSAVPTPRPVPWSNPLTVYRCIMACLLATILLGATPDVMVLFAWGEASNQTMDTLFLIDRIGDGLTIIPFFAAAVLSEWGHQVVPQQLLRDTKVLIQRPKWRTVKNELKIAGMTLVIAIGVTVAKAKVGA